MTFLGLNSLDWWTIATAVAVTSSCALLGTFLVLRRMSMLGDAISHAVLPGLAMAFIISGSRGIVPMLIGAVAVGLLTALLSSLLSRRGAVSEDAAIGVVFTTLFAAGVLMINAVARSVDLDPGCVLYGMLETVPLDTRSVLGADIPRAFIPLAIVLTINLLGVTLFYKELKIVCFDAALATTLGISAGIVHYALMTVVAATTVVSFEAVGSILVIAMLVAPPATAQLFTDRLPRILGLAVFFGAAAAVLGYLAALRFETNSAGMIAVVAALQFALAIFVAPRHGLIARFARRLSLSARICREDLLGIVYRVDEAGRTITASQALRATGQPVLARLALRQLFSRGQMSREAAGIHLTDAGRAAARMTVRTHRLWEVYLSRELGLPSDHVHEPAHRMEHFLSPALTGKIERRLTESGVVPLEDPHGKQIPRAE